MTAVVSETMSSAFTKVTLLSLRASNLSHRSDSMPTSYSSLYFYYITNAKFTIVSPLDRLQIFGGC